jgi:signal transduction histidine kinase
VARDHRTFCGVSGVAVSPHLRRSVALPADAFLSHSTHHAANPITNRTGSHGSSREYFKPIQENGPLEIRSLINAFNHMVIRLARQQNTLRQYAHKSLLSQEEERQRLSRELHDGPLQDLVGLHQRIELYQNELVENPQQAANRLQEINQIIDHSIEDVRNISVALRPPVLDDLGLPAAIESLCKEMTKLISGLSCTFSLSGKQQRLSSEMELAIYRIIQEALSNIRKHVPNATQVKVELAFAKTEVKATIRNDGAPLTIRTYRCIYAPGTWVWRACMNEHACLVAY